MFYFATLLIWLFTQMNISSPIILFNGDLKFEIESKIEVYNILDNDVKTISLLLDEVC